MVTTHTVMVTPSPVLKSHLNDFCVHFIQQCTLYPTVHTLSHSAHTISQNAHIIPQCAHFTPQCTKNPSQQSGHFIPHCTSYPTVPTLSKNAHILSLLCFYPTQITPMGVWQAHKATRVMLCLLVFSNSNSLIHYFTTSMLLHENLEPSNWTKWGQRTMNNLLFLTTVTAR